MDKRSLAEILIDMKLITSERLIEIEQLQKNKPDMSLERLLLESNTLTELELIRAKVIFYQMPWIDLREREINPLLISLIPEKLARRYVLLPLEIQEDGIHIAIANPRNILAFDEVQIVSGKPAIPHLAMASQILESIERVYGLDQHLAHQMIQQLEEEVQVPNEELNLDLDVNQAPIIRLVNHVILQALQSRASDIHIEPGREETQVRYRIDGVLNIANKYPRTIHPPLLSRLKIMANLDISQHFVPQDGSISYPYGEREIDLRISILPTIYGEKVVIRILNQNTQILSLEELGFAAEDLVLYQNLLNKNHGILLITGPTGSGKTTTLTSSIRLLASPSINISTVEDPVEYRIDQINQIQVNTKTGLTFAKALRSLLRQDPDIIMIGEIRDEETANIAIRAALTGHLVLSSVHTNDALSTITRLTNMQIPLHLIQSSLLGVVAQRLVRRICPECRMRDDRELQKLSLVPHKHFNPLKAYLGKGCSKCNNTGYSGRIGIFEILLVGAEGQKCSEPQTIEQLNWYRLSNNKNLLADALQKVDKGLTTVDEIIRVIL